MTREEALSLFLNIPQEKIYIQMDGSYIDENRGLKYKIYTDEEAKDIVKEIIINNLYRYNISSLFNFIEINKKNFQYSAYTPNVAQSLIAEVINSKLPSENKNSLILQLMSSFDDFFEYEIKQYNGFGGFLGSIDSKEYPKVGYLIYIFNL